MSNDIVFRGKSFGGYNKTDVNNYVEEMDNKLEEVRSESKKTIDDLKLQLEKLQKKYDREVRNKQVLEKEIEGFLLNKEALVKMELDTHQRVKNMINDAKLEAEKIVSEAKLEADNHKNNMITAVEEAKLIQENIDDLCKEFEQKNLEMKNCMSKFQNKFQIEES